MMGDVDEHVSGVGSARCKYFTTLPRHACDLLTNEKLRNQIFFHLLLFLKLLTGLSIFLTYRLPCFFFLFGRIFPPQNGLRFLALISFDKIDSFSAIIFMVGLASQS